MNCTIWRSSVPGPTHPSCQYRSWTGNSIRRLCSHWSNAAETFRWNDPIEEAYTWRFRHQVFSGSWRIQNTLGVLLENESKSVWKKINGMRQGNWQTMLFNRRRNPIPSRKWKRRRTVHCLRKYQQSQTWTGTELITKRSFERKSAWNHQRRVQGKGTG